MNTRATAAVVLTRVFDERRSLSAVLPDKLDKVNKADRSLIQEVCYGVMRWYPRLEWFVGQLLNRPLKARDRDIHSLLLVGVYQFLYMRIPAHAVVNETVAAATVLGKPWARRMINAVLRTMQRDHERLSAAMEQNEEAVTAHPSWILKIIKLNWPDAWQGVIEANNQRPPMTLRVNRGQMDRSAYLQAMLDEGIDGEGTVHTRDGIEVTTPVDVIRLPGFKRGWVSVQDAAAQLAAPLLDVQPGQHILDACAAPGGKTAHILELQTELGELIALDVDPQRLQRIAENLSRLNLHARLVCGDAAEPRQWWDGVPFDRILVDAPCSATGVIRRHPDIKYLRRPQDVNTLADLQGRILEGLWPLLKPGGMLLYVTCSVLRAENTEQIVHFLDHHEDAVEIRIAAPWGHELRVGRQILPGEYNMDGFYFATISKR